MSKIHIIEHKHNLWFYVRFQLSEWITVHHTSYADVEIPALDGQVISGWKIFIYMRLQSGHYVSLPLRFYSTNLFSASIDAVVRIGKIRLIWTLYDIREEFTLPSADVGIFAIDSQESALHPDLNFLNFYDVQEQFQLPELL